MSSELGIEQRTVALIRPSTKVAFNLKLSNRRLTKKYL